MKARLVKDHPTEWCASAFPTFSKGTNVDDMDVASDDCFKDWHACKIDGHETFVPITFVQDGKLTRDYNPTELSATKGDIITIKEIVNAWLLATDSTGVTGWVPAEVVVTL